MGAGDRAAWEVAGAMGTAAKLEAISGHRAEACVAYGRKLERLRTIDPQGVYRDELPGELAATAAGAASCVDKAARAWRAGATPQ